MATKFSSIPIGFHVNTKNTIDERFILTKEEMLTELFSHGSRLLMPSPYFAICKDDSKFYIYDRNSTPSETTGYFHPIGLELGEAEDGQILMYKDNEWTPVDFADGKSIIFMDENGGLSIYGYSSAQEGQMLVKSSSGISWVAAVSREAIDEAVAECNRITAECVSQVGQIKTDCNNIKVECTLAQQNCEAIQEEVGRRFWFGTISEYNALETIYEDCAYVIIDGELVIPE